MMNEKRNGGRDDIEIKSRLVLRLRRSRGIACPELDGGLGTSGNFSILFPPLRSP
jgi:hypothetical protein